MMSANWLFLIIPLSFYAGFAVCAILGANKDKTNGGEN